MSNPTVGIDTRMSVSVEERKPTLSPTAVDNYEACGARLEFYLNPDIPGQTTLGLATGRAWHWGMEQWGRLRIASQQGVVSIDDLADDWMDRLHAIITGHLIEDTNRDDFVWQPGDDISQAVAELWTMQQAWASDPNYMWLAEDGSVTVDTVEVRVLTEMGSPHHQMHGYIDAVFRLIDEPILVDYKSAGRAWGSPKVYEDKESGRLMGDPRKLIQAPLYAEAYERSTGERVNWVVFDVMTKAGRFQRVWVDVSPERRQPFITRWQLVSQAIHLHQSAGVPMAPNPGSFLCSPKWCSYWDICPMGEPLERKASNDE